MIKIPVPMIIGPIRVENGGLLGPLYQVYADEAPKTWKVRSRN